MLVLSRQVDEKIVFPALGISIQVIRSTSSKVRLGIDAPRDVTVLRGELADADPCRWTADSRPQVSGGSGGCESGLQAAIRSRIHLAAHTLNQLHRLTEKSQWQEAEDVIFRLFAQLKTMDAEVAAMTSSQPAATRSADGVRALLVDDNDNETRLLSSYLKIKGVEVSLAANGKEAMELLSTATSQPDIVLLDMNMPEFNGKWTIDRIREDHDLNGLSVFAVSGTEQADSDVEVGPNGVNGWFRKPLNPESLLTAITKQVGPQHDPCLN